MTPTTAPQRMPAWLEQAWLTRYLDRELDGAETAWFEAYLLDKPELLIVVDADTRLRDALADDTSAGRGDAPSASAYVTGSDATAESSSASVIPGSSFPRKRESSLSSSRGNNRSSWLALAATLVVGLGLGSMAMRMFAPSRGAELIASPTRIIYDTMRGEAAPPRVEHADSTSPLVLIEVAVPPGARNIVLHVDGEREQPLTSSPDGFVSFLLPRELAQQRKPSTVSYALADGSGKHSIDLEMPAMQVK